MVIIHYVTAPLFIERILMIPIYICEDNPEILRNQSDIIQKHCMIQNYDFKIEIASTDPYKVLERLKESDQRGIYFLDIDLNSNINGFDLGIKVREHDTRGFITYITTHEELMIETFKLRLEVMDYIVKDDFEDMEERIEATLDQIHKYLSEHEQLEDDYFKVKSFGTIRQINTKDILFFETSPKKHVIVLHLSDEILEFSGSLSDVEEQVSDSFIRSHRSFLVNKDKIKAFDSKNLTVSLEGQKKALVSRAMRKHMKDILEVI